MVIDSVTTFDIILNLLWQMFSLAILSPLWVRENCPSVLKIPRCKIGIFLLWVSSPLPVSSHEHFWCDKAIWKKYLCINLRILSLKQRKTNTIRCLPNASRLNCLFLPARASALKAYFESYQHQSLWGWLLILLLKKKIAEREKGFAISPMPSRLSK